MAIKPFLGIDLGGTNMQIGVADHTGKVLGRSRKKTAPEQGLEKVIERIVDGVMVACSEAKLTLREVGGLGIGAPAPVDPATGVIVEAPNLRWNNVPLAKILKDKLRIPVYVDNDVNVAVYGECRFGAGKGHRNLMGVWIGTGVGGGLVLDGKIYQGHFFTGGEIGHTILMPNGPYGLRSVEQICSRTAIARRLESLIKANHKSSLIEMTQGTLSGIKSKMIAKAYMGNDKLTRSVVDNAADLLGASIATSVTLLGLPLVVLGGGLTEAIGEPFVQRVKASVRENCLYIPLRQVEVVASKLEDDAGLLGASMMAREAFSK